MAPLTLPNGRFVGRCGAVFVEPIRYDGEDALLYAIDNPAGDSAGRLPR